MIDDPRAAAMVAALDTALADTLELQRGTDIKEFFAPGGSARFLREPALRMARHFDLAPAFLVLDPTLGSLGIVEVALPSIPGDQKAAAVVQRHVDTATYARHLLLRDKNLDGRKALNVELVLLTANETPAEQDFFNEMGNVLRQTLRDSDSLYHIGVGVLCYGAGDRPFHDRLRRAFPWLLRATRRWLQSDDAKPWVAGSAPPAAGVAAPPTGAAAPLPAPAATVPAGPAAPGQRRLRQVTLTNYRLPGTRSLVFADARVHLIHGPNGSGKSSIVEALELVSTGKVDRLEQAQEKQYDAVIKNRALGAEATIALVWSSAAGPAEPGTPQPVIASGLTAPLAPGLEASSFRLDQPLMDRLIGKYPHERARDFLRVFFPEAKDSLAEYVRSAEVRAATVPALRGLVETLTAARVALARHARFNRPTTGAPGEMSDYPDLLNRWLERTALLDLLRKSRAVQATMQAAQTAGWSPDELSVTRWLGALGPAQDLATIDRFEREAAAELDALQRALDEYKAFTSTAAAGLSTDKVTAQQAKALNDVCRFLFKEDVLKSYGLFGDKVVRVINAADAPTYGPMTIGGDHWADPLIAQIDSLVAACQAVETDKPAPEWPAENPPSEYQAARTAQLDAIEAGREISERFIDRLRPRTAKAEFDGSLIAAVNELMALFTPARWGYEDIDLPSTASDGKVGVNLELGAGERPVRAELHLNTAELNLFTVALFMLCAARVPKPLNLLLFDDPLQNMDELTSTSLARGLTKVVRLWAALGRDEQLLLLFHGNDDLERFSREIASATYRLPWLSPSALSTTPPIEVENAPGNMAVQSIGPLIEARPPF